MTVHTNVAAYVGPADAVPVIRPPQVEVCLDGAAEPRLRLDALEMSAGGGLRAAFSAGLGQSVETGDDMRLERLAAVVRPGRTARATLLRGGVLAGQDAVNLVLFEGRIGRIEMALGPDGEGLRFEAEDPAVPLLGRCIGGRRTWTSYGDAKRIDGLPLVFNPYGRPNASPQQYDPGAGGGGGGAYTIFAADTSADAIPWTLDEAVAHLLSEYGESEDVVVPTAAEVRAAVSPLAIRDVTLEGRTLGDALAEMLRLTDACLVATAEPGPDAVVRRLEIVRADGGPASWLAHQPVGRTYAAGATNFSALTASFHFDDAPRRYVARGDVKLYESTFDLVAGWDDSLATYDADDFSPATNTNFDAVRDVFRKWVLNEAGDYTASPYSRGAAADLGAVFEGAPYVRRRRRFLPCVSSDDLGRSRGVHIEMSVDGGESWERLSLGVRVLADECGIVLTDDPLPPQYLAAAMRGSVRIRVTATIESDSRLAAECGDAEDAGQAGRVRHISAASGYRFRRVASTSLFYGHGPTDEVDDTARLQELVRAAYDADRAAPAPSRIQIPYLALGHRVGERILGVRGRMLELAPRYAEFVAAPVVRRVRHTFAPVPQTELELE